MARRTVAEWDRILKDVETSSDDDDDAELRRSNRLRIEAQCDAVDRLARAAIDEAVANHRTVPPPPPTTTHKTAFMEAEAEAEARPDAAEVTRRLMALADDALGGGDRTRLMAEAYDIVRSAMRGPEETKSARLAKLAGAVAARLGPMRSGGGFDKKAMADGLAALLAKGLAPGSGDGAAQG